MNKARKEAAKKKSLAQRAATQAKKLQTAPPESGEPSSSEDLFERGTTALTNEAFTSAIDLLREAIRLDPKNADCFVSLGTAYAHMGQHDFALAACEMALQMDPEHTIAMENRSHALRALGLPETTLVSATAPDSKQYS